MTTVSLVVLAGLCVGAGLVALAAAVIPSTPGLAGSLTRIGLGEVDGSTTAVDVGPVTTRSERLGAWLFRHTPIPLSERQRRLLRLQDTSVAEFFADKLVMAVVGALLPGLVAAGLLLMSGSVGPWPALFSVLGAVLGYFLPDLLLRRSDEASRSRAVESLLLYIDLVTLERLANASSTQALRSAAALSDVPVFRQIRGALDRAALEQQPPYGELRRLGDQLELVELIDIADVMQLDEAGAALSDALRARVRELRDAHLNDQHRAASAAAEGMTIYMTIPALIFALIFMVGALLNLVQAG